MLRLWLQCKNRLEGLHSKCCSLLLVCLKIWLFFPIYFCNAQAFPWITTWSSSLSEHASCNRTCPLRRLPLHLFPLQWSLDSRQLDYWGRLGFNVEPNIDNVSWLTQVVILALAGLFWYVYESCLGHCCLYLLKPCLFVTLYLSNAVYTSKSLMRINIDLILQLW